MMAVKSMMTAAILCGAVVCGTSQRSFAQQHVAYRLEYRTVYRPQTHTSYRIQYETVYKPQKVVTYKRVWETRHRVRNYTVRRQVWETKYRDEKYVTYEKQISTRTDYVDRGCWQDQQICVPGRITNRLKWQPAGCVTDPNTGQTVYRFGGPAWVSQQRPSQIVSQRVWRPNVVAVQTPQTRMVARCATRKIPVQVCKTIDEARQEKIPYQVCKMVAVEKTIQVAHCVEKRVPVSCTNYVARLECFRVPIDPCTGAPLGYAPLQSSGKEPTLADPEIESDDSSDDRPGPKKDDLKKPAI